MVKDGLGGFRLFDVRVLESHAPHASVITVYRTKDG